MNVSASVFPEIEIMIEGDVDPGEAPTGPTYDCGGTPGHDAFVEGFDVRGIVINGVDILAGADRNEAEIVLLLARLERAIAGEAEMALLEEAGE